MMGVYAGCQVLGNMNLCALLDTIGIKKSTAEVDDFFAAPSHDEAARVCDVCYVDALEVFFVGLGDEISDFRAINANGHAFLRFGNGKFGAIESVVFFRDCIEVDHQ
jgi:hypothetical protein